MRAFPAWARASIAHMLISAGNLVGVGEGVGLDRLVPPALRDRLDRLDVLSRRVLAGKLPGERRSKRRGQSVEFDDYRPYVPGDDLRHVDWNVYARFDRFVLKMFREEEDLSVHLLIDASASMSTGTERGLSKLEWAHRLGMALAYLALVAQNRVEVSVVGAGLSPARPGGVVTLAALRGRRAVAQVAAFLGDSLSRPLEDRARSGADLGEAMRSVALRRAARGVMVVVSDFLPAAGGSSLTRGLNYLASGSVSGRYDTHCVQVLSPGELDPATLVDRGLVGDLRLTDVETGRMLDVTITRDAVSAYKRRLGASMARLERDCLARSMSYLRVTSEDDVGTLLLGTLRRRGLVG